MTSITIGKKHDHHAYIQASGHATGSPEVCAAITYTLGALAGYLENVQRGQLDHFVDVTKMMLTDGEAEIEAEGDEAVMAAFDTAIIGLMQIAKANPEYARVIEREYF